MSRSAFDRHYYDANNWKLGFIYFCKADQRIVVPKRLRGLGWTLNFARPLAWPFLGLLLAFAFGARELLRSLNGSVGLAFAVALLLILGLLGLCYRLSIPRPSSTPSDDVAAGKPR
jgi:hypothetical protein